MMKIVLVFLAALLLAGCATPAELAAGETVKMEAAQAAADRELIRKLAVEYANKPAPTPFVIQAPPPVIVQPPQPDYTKLFLAVMTVFFLTAVGMFFLFARIASMTRTPPATETRVILLATGRGQYQIIDRDGRRPLIWSNPADVKLLEDVQR